MLIVIFLLVSALQVSCVFLSKRSTLGFLSRHSDISDQSALEDFKNLVRPQMKGALLLMIPIGLISIALTFSFIFRNEPIGVLISFIANVLIFFQSRSLKNVEKRARNLSCISTLEDEYRQIGQAWVKQPWPNF